MKKAAYFLAAGIGLVLILAACAPKEKMPRIIPMKDFFRNPEIMAFQLSPDGQYLAFLKPWQTRLNVNVQKIGEGEERRITSATERDIAGYFWASNSRIAYVQDKGGDENFRLYAVNIDGSEERDLTPFEKVRVQLIDDLKDDDEHILAGMNQRDPRLFDAYRINVLTGEMEMIAQNPGNIVGWETDHDARLRVATTSDGVNRSLLYRDSEKDNFEVLLTTSFKETLSPLFFTYDNKNLYVASTIGRDKTAVYEYEVKEKKQTTLLYENPGVDVENLLRSDKRKIVTGVAYYTDKRQYHFLDEERAKLQQDGDGRPPGYEVALAGMSRDETKALVYTGSDRTLGAYYFYDRTTSDFRKLADVGPWLVEAELAEMKPITYTSRDGLTGCGRQFWEAGFKQWGLKIQDDITDGVKWLIDQGIADPKRVGIYGGSFGGDATLARVGFSPGPLCLG